MADKDVKVGLVLSAQDKASGIMAKVFSKAEKSAERLSNLSSKMGMFGTAGIVAGGAVTAYFGKALKDANAATKAAKQLDAVFGNVGKNGLEIAAQGKEMAEAYQFKIGIDAEEIEGAQTKLAKFHQLYSTGAQQAQIFQRATKTAFDMQAAGMGDAATNADALGRALNDPLNNLGAIGKLMKGKLNDTQKEHIKNLYAQNKAVEAQTYVLGLVEDKFKGVAEKTKTNGMLMDVELKDLNKTIGKELQPAYKALMSQVVAFIPKVTSFVKEHKGLITALGKGAVGLLLFSTAIKGLSFGLSGFVGVAKGAKAVKSFVNSADTIKKLSLLKGSFLQAKEFAMIGFDATKQGIGNSVKFIGSGFSKSAAFAKVGFNAVKSGVVDSVKFMSNGLMQAGKFLMANPIILIIAAIALAAFLIYKNWDKIAAFFKGIWEPTKKIFFATWNWIKNMFLNFTPYGLIIKHWDKISGMFSKVWDKVKKVFTGVWDWMKSLGSKFFDAGKNIVVSIGKGIMAMAMLPVKAITKIVSSVRRFLPFSPAKEGPLKDIHKIKLVETIAHSMTAKPLLDAWGNVTGQLYGKMNQPVPAFANNRNSGGSGQANFRITINLNGGATQKDASMLSDTLKKQLDKWYKDMQHNNGRVSF